MGQRGSWEDRAEGRGRASKHHCSECKGASSGESQQRPEVDSARSLQNCEDQSVTLSQPPGPRQSATAVTGNAHRGLEKHK